MLNDVVAIVAATYPSRGIGIQGAMPWPSLPPDMSHFRHVTSTVTTRPISAVVNPASTITSSCIPIIQKRNAVVMGRKTWESIPLRYRPLAKRLNVVVTSRAAPHTQELTTIADSNAAADADASGNKIEEEKHKNLWFECDLNQAVDRLRRDPAIDTIFIIGGGNVYAQALQWDFLRRIYYTEVILPTTPQPFVVNGSSNSHHNNNKNPAAVAPEPDQFDTFFPELEDSIWRKSILPPVPSASSSKTETPPDHDKENGGPSKATTGVGANDATLMTDNNTLPPWTDLKGFATDSESGIKYRFVQYQRRNVEEMQYLNLCQQVISKGVKRNDRTGTGTLSQFGAHMRFSLREGRLPLLTTKRTFWRGVAEELLWFISGNTNGNVLAAKGIHIWDGNGSREFLDQRGLSHREVGDLGPVYGFQWRHFGATYVDMHTDYTGQGVDQLADCIDKIIHHPEDRRIIMSAWNPADLNQMALPPCHMFCQFYVDTTSNELSCQMYQRSADLGLGVPFNIASYALLTHLIAHVTGRLPGEFIHTMGDAHVYANHVDALKQQLTREPRDFPYLRIRPTRSATNANTMNIDDFVLEDLEVDGYNPHPAIKMVMAV